MIMIMMAEDYKTEKPTPKKKKDSREKGEVAKSSDANTAFLLLAVFAAFKIFGSYYIEKIGEILSFYLSNFDNNSQIITAQDANSIFFKSILSFFVVLLPILSTSVIAALIINYVQVGFMFSKKALKPKFSKLNPIEGFKRMVSLRSLVELAKSTLKSVIIVYLVYIEIKKSFDTFPTLMSSDIITSLKYITDIILSVSLKLALALLIFSLFDYLYQWWEHQRKLKMSKQEVKDEHKQIEGDPKVKAKIRQKQMQIGMARMMRDVLKADFVITNPTHYAIAIKYDEKEDSAPVVLAKGKDYVALKIKEKARENKIRIIENKPLAQAMFDAVEIGEQIPQEFYVAIAKILADIYSIKNKY